CRRRERRTGRTRLGAAHDEGDVGAVEAELGKGTVVERKELIGGPLAAPPAAIGVRDGVPEVPRGTADRPRDVLDRGRQRGGARRVGAAMESREIAVDPVLVENPG